jgi:outer membrane biosynthesis protein TonB
VIERSQERLAVSFLIALAFHLIFALFLSFIDWDRGGDPSRLKPVVIFASAPEDLPESPPPKPEPEPEPVPEPRPAPAVSEAAPAPDAASPPAARTRPPQESSPLPSEVPRIAPPALPQAPPKQESVRDQFSEGSEIVYGDDASGESAELSRAPEKEEPAPETESLLEDSDLEQRLGAISSREAAGSAASGETGQEPSSSSESATSGRAVSSQPVIELEGGEDRELLRWVAPDITPDMLEGLPQRFPIEVAFFLRPDGRPFNPRVSPSSGRTDLDNVIQNAVRNWQFSELENASGEDVSGKVRLLIQVQ